MNSTDIARNPERLKPGSRCFGVCLASFRPDASADIIPGSRAVVPGTAMGDYACKPRDSDGDTLYFLPDEPFEKTQADSPFYSLQNWMISESRVKTMAVRASLANAAIAAYRADISDLEQYI